MDRDRHERIRERAHGIWEREGRQEGSHDANWQRAERELDVEEQEGRTDLPPDEARQISGEEQAGGSSRRKR